MAKLDFFGLLKDGATLDTIDQLHKEGNDIVFLDQKEAEGLHGASFESPEVFNNVYQEAFKQYDNYQNKRYFNDYFQNDEIAAPTPYNVLVRGDTSGIAEFGGIEQAKKEYGGDFLKQFVVRADGSTTPLNTPEMIAWNKGYFWEDGNKKPLEKDGLMNWGTDLFYPKMNENGEWELNKLKKDEVSPYGEVIGLLGPARYGAPWYQHYATGILGGAVGTMGEIASVAAIAENLLFDIEDSWADKLATRGHNFHEWLSRNDPDQTGFSVTNVANVYGQVMQNIALAMATMGGSLALAGGKAALQGGAKLTSKAMLGQMSKYAIGAGHIQASIGGMQSAGMALEQAKQMGMDSRIASVVAALYGLTTYGVEQKLFGQNILLKSFLNGADQAVVKKTVAEMQNDIIEAIGKNYSKDAFKPASSILAKGTKKWYEHLTGRMNVLQESATESTLGKFVGASLEEGSEEAVEGAVDNYINIAADAFHKTFVPKHTEDVIYGNSWDDAFSPDRLTEFALGAVAGFGGAVTNRMLYGKQNKNNRASTYLKLKMQNKGDIFKDVIMSQANLGQLGSTTEGPEGVLVNGDKKPSWNDVVKQELLAEVEQIDNLWDSVGLKEFMSKNGGDVEEVSGVPGSIHSAVGEIAKQAMMMRLHGRYLDQEIAKGKQEGKDVASLEAQKVIVTQVAKEFWDGDTKTSKVYDRWYNDIRMSYWKDKKFDAAKLHGLNKENEYNGDRMYDYGYLREMNDRARKATEADRLANEQAKKEAATTQDEVDTLIGDTEFDFSSDTKPILDKVMSVIRNAGITESNYAKLKGTIKPPKFDKDFRNRIADAIRDRTGNDSYRSIITSPENTLYYGENTVAKLIQDESSEAGLPDYEGDKKPLNIAETNAIIDFFNNDPESLQQKLIEERYTTALKEIEGAKKHVGQDPVKVPDFDPLQSFASNYAAMLEMTRNSPSQRKNWDIMGMEDFMNTVRGRDSFRDSEFKDIDKALRHLETAKLFADAELNVFSSYEPDEKRYVEGHQLMNPDEHKAVTRHLANLEAELKEIRRNAKPESVAVLEQHGAIRKNSLLLNLTIHSTMLKSLGKSTSHLDPAFTQLHRSDPSKANIMDLLDASEKIYFDSLNSLNEKERKALLSANGVKVVMNELMGAEGLANIKSRFTPSPNDAQVEFYYDSDRLKRAIKSNDTGDVLFAVKIIAQEFQKLKADNMKLEKAYQDLITVSINSVGKNLKYAPSYEQKEIIKQAVIAQTYGEPIDIVNYMLDAAEYKFARPKWHKGFWIRGFPGTGKTLLMPEAVLHVFMKYNGGHKPLRIGLVAADKTSVARLKKVIPTAYVKEFYEETVLNVEKLPADLDFIIVDEVSYLGREFMEKLLKHDSFILALGDEFQSSYRGKDGLPENSWAPLSFYGSTPLTFRYRTQRPQFGDLQNAFAQRINQDILPSLPALLYNNIEGGRYAATIDEIIRAFIQKVKDDPDTRLIVTNRNQLKALLANKEFREDLIKLDDKILFAEWNESNEDGRFAQGGQYNNVYVAISENELDRSYNNNMNMAVSRAKNFVMLQSSDPSRSKFSDKVPGVTEADPKMFIDEIHRQANTTQVLIGNIVNKSSVSGSFKKTNAGPAADQSKKLIEDEMEKVVDIGDDTAYKYDDDLVTRVHAHPLFDPSFKKHALNDDMARGYAYEKVITKILDDQEVTNDDRTWSSPGVSYTVPEDNVNVLREALHNLNLGDFVHVISQPRFVAQLAAAQGLIALTPDIALIRPNGDIHFIDVKSTAQSHIPYDTNSYKKKSAHYLYGGKKKWGNVTVSILAVRTNKDGKIAEVANRDITDYPEVEALYAKTPAGSGPPPGTGTGSSVPEGISWTTRMERAWNDSNNRGLIVQLPGATYKETLAVIRKMRSSKITSFPVTIKPVSDISVYMPFRKGSGAIATTQFEGKEVVIGVVYAPYATNSELEIELKRLNELTASDNGSYIFNVPSSGDLIELNFTFPNKDHHWQSIPLSQIQEQFRKDYNYEMGNPYMVGHEKFVDAYPLDDLGNRIGAPQRLQVDSGLADDTYIEQVKTSLTGVSNSYQFWHSAAGKFIRANSSGNNPK